MLAVRVGKIVYIANGICIVTMFYVVYMHVALIKFSSWPCAYKGVCMLDISIVSPCSAPNTCTTAACMLYAILTALHTSIQHA